MDETRTGRRVPPTWNESAERHVKYLRESAAEKRAQAEQYFQIARESRTTADRITYEEFGRRALEVARRFDSAGDTMFDERRR